MNPVSPSQSITINESPLGIEIVIPARRNLFITMSYPLMIIIWGIVAYFIMSSYFGDENGSDKSALLVGLAICSLFGALVTYTWFFNLVGKERILINHQALSIKLDIYGYGISRKFDLRLISNFRPEERRGALTPFISGHYRKIAFDYKNDVHGFGVFYDEREAQAITNKLQMHHDVTRRSITPN